MSVPNKTRKQALEECAEGFCGDFKSPLFFEPFGWMWSRSLFGFRLVLVPEDPDSKEKRITWLDVQIHRIKMTIRDIVNED